MNRPFQYSIITPAFNEAGFIENTLESVLKQTVLPLKWVIVNDGSTDETAEIIKKYAKKYEFIQYYYRERLDGQAYFASNVYAIMDGYKKLQKLKYDFLAILDADITLPENYYEKIIEKFSTDQKLGVASGIYKNLINGKLHNVLNDRRSTPKAIQVFRKNVFDKIGGYLPLEYGGEDTIACVMARMDGWKTWSYPDIKVVHHRPTGTGAVSNTLQVRFRQGICEYNLASHPLFFLVKALRRALLEKPYLLGGALRLCGYFWAFVRGDKCILPSSVVKFIRDEHIKRIQNLNKVT